MRLLLDPRVTLLLGLFMGWCLGLAVPDTVYDPWKVQALMGWYRARMQAVQQQLT